MQAKALPVEDMRLGKVLVCRGKEGKRILFIKTFFYVSSLKKTL